MNVRVRSEGTGNNALSVSIVVPCYNEATRLPPFLEELFLACASDERCTILVVDDGSNEGDVRTISEALEKLKCKHPRVPADLIRRRPNRGKGAAIEAGFLRASSDIVGFVDADGSVTAATCLRLVRELRSSPDLDAVVGSRVRLLGREVHRSPLRHYVGRVFATIISVMFRFPIYDTQCGAKFFVRERVLDEITWCVDKRWVWDTQLLMLLLQNGKTVREVPIDWHETEGSRMSLVRDGIGMLSALARFRFFEFAQRRRSLRSKNAECRTAQYRMKDRRTLY